MIYLFTIILGAVISFIASIPVGAVNMAVVQATLNNSRKSAYMIGLGAIFMEATYCAIPLFSLSFDPQENSNLVQVIYLISIPILIGIGVYSIINRKRAAIRAVRKQTTPKSGNQILYGALLCGTNPMVLLFWAGITATLTARGWLGEDLPLLFSFLAGVPIGTFFLYYIFVQVAYKKKKNIGLATRAKINFLVGLIFILLGSYLIVNYLMRFWF